MEKHIIVIIVGDMVGSVPRFAGAMYLVLYVGENAARLEVPNAKLTDIKYTNVEDPNGRFYVGKFK